MKPIQLIILGSFFLLSCSTAKQDFNSIELVAYNYIFSSEEIELKCYLYTTIDKEGNALNYQWKKYSQNESLYSKAVVDKSLIDSILVAYERQLDYLKRNADTIRLDDGPCLKIKIIHSNGTSEIIDFFLDNVLFKYFQSVFQEDKLEPTTDTTYIIKKKFELMNIAWKEDSVFFKGKMPKPIISYN
jgi:hypothetical protein